MTQSWKAGPELDAEVARVMAMPLRDGGPPPYSTDDNAAQEVIFFLGAKLLERDVPDGVSATLIVPCYARRTPEDLSGHGRGDTLAHAICNAALDLVERHGGRVFSSRSVWPAVKPG